MLLFPFQVWLTTIDHNLLTAHNLHFLLRVLSPLGSTSLAVVSSHLPC